MTAFRTDVIHNLSNYVFCSCSELSETKGEMVGDSSDPVADTQNRHVSKRKKHKQKGKGK